MAEAQAAEEAEGEEAAVIIHAVSDLHGNLPRIPPGDVLLIAGDIVPLRCHAPADAARWLDGAFRDWLKTLPVTHVVAVWGNHDFIGQHPEMVPTLPWTLLQDKEVTLTVGGEQLRVYGAPWSVSFGPWAFMKPERELGVVWRAIPRGLDVLMVHGPANRMLDCNVGGECCGSISLRKKIEEVRPKVVVCGHIHEAAGAAVADGTRYLNVSLVDEMYRPVNSVVTFEGGTAVAKEAEVCGI